MTFLRPFLGFRHCDVKVFEWLIRYIKARHGAESSTPVPTLNPKMVISILVSSEFLKMCNGFDINSTRRVFGGLFFLSLAINAGFAAPRHAVYVTSLLPDASCCDSAVTVL